MKLEKNNMLTVLENYRLKTPDSDTATMPQGLRKEVREFVSQYVGHYTSELRTVKQLKMKMFFELNKLKLKQDIMHNSKTQLLIKNFNNKYYDFKAVYQEVVKDESLSISNSIHGMDSDVNQTTVDVSGIWINTRMDDEFDRLYEKGFKEFDEILTKFEKKIEEAVIFATITEVYKLITEYAKFEPYLKKLSDLKIK